MARFDKKIWQEWRDLCETVQNASVVDMTETQREIKERRERAAADYEYFFTYYLSHYATAPCAEFQLDAAKVIKESAKIDIVMEWYRSSAKSVHATIGIPLWLMFQNDMRYMVVVSDNEKKAMKLMSSIQAELEYNRRIIHDYGEQKAIGSWSEGEFVTTTGVAFAALGIQQSPRGLRERDTRPDYIVVDDADTRSRCKNESRVREAAEWCVEDLRGCFDARDGARERYLHVNNRIHKNSILGVVLEMLPNAVHSRVDALDENGEATWPGKTSTAYWEAKRAGMAYRSFMREYMNTPIEAGKVFKADWIEWGDMLPLDQYDSLLTYGDLSYRTSGDYKAVALVGRKGRMFHVIDFFCRRSSLPQVAKWLYDLEQHTLNPSKAAATHYVEGNFIQDSFVNDFDEEGEERGWYIPVIPDKRKKPDKFLRIEKSAAFYERRMVIFNERFKKRKDFQDAIDQILAFEKGSSANDDAPDALEGAIYLLNKRTARQRFRPVIGRRLRPKSLW